MCRRVSCPSCNKPTFAGCGMHVEQVLGDVPAEHRCACNEQAPSARDAAPKRRAPWPFG
jgi:hypothetical protein